MHNIRFSTYPEDVNKESVQDEWDQYATIEGRGKGSYGLSGKIKWHEEIICDNYDEAVKTINEIDNCWYDQIEVKFIDNSEKPIPSSLKSKMDRLQNEKKKYLDLFKKQHYTSENTKSKFLSCKKCNSKIAVSYLKGNHCPVCGNDLRPISTLELIKKKKELINSLEATINTEEAKLKEKCSSKGRIMWLVKIEYHT